MSNNRISPLKFFGIILFCYGAYVTVKLFIAPASEVPNTIMAYTLWLFIQVAFSFVFGAIFYLHSDTTEPDHQNLLLKILDNLYKPNESFKDKYTDTEYKNITLLKILIRGGILFIVIVISTCLISKTYHSSIPKLTDDQVEQGIISFHILWIISALISCSITFMIFIKTFNLNIYSIITIIAFFMSIYFMITLLNGLLLDSSLDNTIRNKQNELSQLEETQNRLLREKIIKNNQLHSIKINDINILGTKAREKLLYIKDGEILYKQNTQ